MLHLAGFPSAPLPWPQLFPAESSLCLALLFLSYLALSGVGSLAGETWGNYLLGLLHPQLLVFCPAHSGALWWMQTCSGASVPGTLRSRSSADVPAGGHSRFGWSPFRSTLTGFILLLLHSQAEEQLWVSSCLWKARHYLELKFCSLHIIA